LPRCTTTVPRRRWWFESSTARRIYLAIGGVSGQPRCSRRSTSSIEWRWASGKCSLLQTDVCCGSVEVGRLSCAHLDPQF